MSEAVKKSISSSVPSFQYTRDIMKHPNLEVGDFTYGSFTIRWLIHEEKVKVGKFCSFSQNIEVLMSGNHPIDTVSTYPFAALPDLWPGAHGKCPYGKGDLVIGNDVWVGKNSVLIGGATIGDGAVIGANSVVAGHIPSYAIAVGNPCRVVRYRFDEQTIKMLLDVKWWDWPEEKIKRNIHLICGKDIWKIKDCE